MTRTKQGFEETIGTNHIGHFYLSQLLLANLGKTSSKAVNSRVVYVGSGVHNPNEPGGDVGSKATLGKTSYKDTVEYRLRAHNYWCKEYLNPSDTTVLPQVSAKHRLLYCI